MLSLVMGVRFFEILHSSSSAQVQNAGTYILTFLLDNIFRVKALVKVIILVFNVYDSYY